jgi:hypothetical protein
MIKLPSLGVRVLPETKAALEKAASDDMRTVSSLVEKVLVEWLRANGYLKKK